MTRTIVPLILLIAALSPMAMAIVIPGLAVIARDLSASYALAQFLVSGFLFGLGLGQLFCGPLADRFGRRPVLIAGVFVFIAGSAICAASNGILLLAVGRVLQAAGAATTGALSRALVGDLFEGASAARVMSYLTATLELSMMLITPIGGRLIDDYGWRSVFWASTGLGAVVLLAVVALLPETRPSGAPRAISVRAVVSDYRDLATNRQFAGNVLLIALIAGAGISLYSVVPLALADNLAYSPEKIGDLLLLNGLALIVGAIAAGRLASGWSIRGAQSVLVVGVLTAAAFFPLCLLFVPMGVLTLLLPLLAISLFRTGIASLALPQAIGAIPRIAGTASGFAGAASTVLTGAFGALGAALYHGSVLPTAIMVLVCVAAAALVYGLFLLPGGERRPVTLTGDQEGVSDRRQAP